jgi:hypothetical protein
LLLWGRESVVVSMCMLGERAVRLLLWGRESVMVGTCMQGERSVRVVVGTGSDGVVRWARAIRHAIRQKPDMHSDVLRCTQTYSYALRRTQMHSDVLRCTQTYSDALRQNQTCNQTYSDALRRDDQTHLERRRSRVGEQRERECLDGGT